MVFFILAGTFASLGKNAGTMAWRCTNLLFSSVTRRLFASTVGQREPLLARTQQPAADFNCLWKHARPRICLINLERRSGGLAVRQRYRSQKKKKEKEETMKTALAHTQTRIGRRALWGRRRRSLEVNYWLEHVSGETAQTATVGQEAGKDNTLLCLDSLFTPLKFSNSAEQRLFLFFSFFGLTITACL